MLGDGDFSLRAADDVFSVVIYQPSGEYEYVRKHVPVMEAVKAVDHYCHCVGARLGVIDKVHMIDALDCVVFEWRRGKGVTFPEDFNELMDQYKQLHKTKDQYDA